MNKEPSLLNFGDTVGEDGIWVQLLNPVQGLGVRPTLFLDRDGVILVETNYLHTAEETALIGGAIETIRNANASAIPVVVVTNQSGIGREMYGWSDFAVVQETMLNLLAEGDAYLNAVMACPFHPDANAPWNVQDHPDRKPNPGMIVRAEKILPIDLSLSWIVGDHATDLEAGKRAGLKGGMHVLSGHGSHPNERAAATNCAAANYTVLKGLSIADAVEKIPLFIK
ncbi:MAG: HAD family hydrolase [Magnetovibrio sp.]|nr:HAD family hydrolase [Magnetovibrio sp.]